MYSLYYRVTILVLGVIWVLITLKLINRVKNHFLYTLFPLTINTVSLVIQSVRQNCILLGILIAILVYLYAFIKMRKSINLYEVIVVPLVPLTLTGLLSE